MNNTPEIEDSGSNLPQLPTLAIVGRPNVGKSSLFNVIVGHRLAIVHRESGVTRDRIVAPGCWKGKHFQVVDTGGLGTFSDESRQLDTWDLGIREQVEVAIAGADILLFVTDVMDGVTPLDKEIARRLRECDGEVLLVPSKADNTQLELQAQEFAELGFDQVFPVSSLHRRGIGDLLAEVLKDIPVQNLTTESNPFRIAVVGRPNVGKSSLVNGLLGEERVMVNEEAGTTRDSIDVDFELEYNGEKLPASLIDTAGLRKRSKVDKAVEKFSVVRAEQAITRAQLVLFVVEASPDGVTAQDRRIADLIASAGKGCLIIANKWDQCDEKQKRVLEEIHYTLPRMTYAPVVFTCALSGYNFGALLDRVAEVMAQMEIQVPTPMLNRVLEDAVKRFSAPVIGKQPFKIYYGTMIGNIPPRFVLFVNNPKLCARNYLGYLTNYLRRCFKFTGLPIRVGLRPRPKRESIISKKSHKDFRRGRRTRSGGGKRKK